MKRTCYIVAGAPPPAMGWQPRTSGVRAEQLAAQARLAFDEVRIILFLERYDLIKRDGGFAILAAPREDTIIVPIDDFDVFCARIAPATFVFSQSEMVEKATQAAQRHTVIYDILSLGEETLARSGASAGELDQFRMQHRRMLTLCKRAVVSSERVADRLAADLRGRDVVLAPLAPAPSTERATGARTHLLFGGRAPRWLDRTTTFRAMAAYLSDNIMPAIMMAPDMREDDPNAVEYSALWLMGHVCKMWNLSVLNQAQVLAMTFAMVDWAPLDEDRAHRTSLQALQAIAAGVPVLHQSNTPLCDMFDPFPGECLAHPLTSADVAHFVDRALSGAYREAIDAARTVLIEARSDATPFAGLAA
ncbi:MAG: hypothetical protein AAGF49_03715 [Pseudomonadota bacterium]